MDTMKRRCEVCGSDSGLRCRIWNWNMDLPRLIQVACAECCTRLRLADLHKWEKDAQDLIKRSEKIPINHRRSLPKIGQTQEQRRRPFFEHITTRVSYLPIISRYEVARES